jgi:hypothetical protein
MLSNISYYAVLNFEKLLAPRRSCRLCGVVVNVLPPDPKVASSNPALVVKLGISPSRSRLLTGSHRYHPGIVQPAQGRSAETAVSLHRKNKSTVYPAEPPVGIWTNIPCQLPVHFIQYVQNYPPRLQASIRKLRTRCTAVRRDGLKGIVLATVSTEINVLMMCRQSQNNLLFRSHQHVM